jgi:hypothetical protein
MQNAFRATSLPGIRIDTRSSVLLAGITAVYAGLMMFFQPEWWLGGGMWAEMALNYFPVADNPDWKVALFATDAGYIPLLQRLIAYAAHACAVRADRIPYFYSFSALVLSPLMVGVFALSRFRPLIGCDLTRLLVVFVVLGSADLELRGFINFTYFAVFFGAVIGALALTENAGPAPRWAWFLPPLMLSKPYVLPLLPLFALALFVARGRFRMVMLAGILALFAQAVRVGVSAREGVMAVAGDASVSLLAKCEALGLFLGGMFGSYLAGAFVWVPFRLTAMVAIGAIGLGVALWMLLRAKHGAGALILAGLALYAGTLVINCFALTSMWDLRLTALRIPNIYRHNFAAYCGGVLILVAMMQILSDGIAPRLAAWRWTRSPVLALFALWFVSAGWAGQSFAFVATPGFPMVGASVWQQSALFIEQRGLPICVPVDPFPWVYGRACHSLADVPQWDGIAALGTEAAPTIVLSPPPGVAQAELRAFAILISPVSPGFAQYRLQARITYGDGQIARFVANHAFRTGASLAYFTGSFPVRDVRSIQIDSDVPMGVLTHGAGAAQNPVVLWMGQ